MDYFVTNVPRNDVTLDYKLRVKYFNTHIFQFENYHSSSMGDGKNFPIFYFAPTKLEHTLDTKKT